jgi:hypothetical protein
MRPVPNRLFSILWITALLPAMLMPFVSCLKEMPESFPEEVVWNPEVAFPLGEERYGLNTVSGFDTSLLDLDTLTGWPQWVNEHQIVLEGIMNFSLASIQHNIEHLNNILFRVNAYNGFPNPIGAQAYFQDASRMTIDSMFQDGPMLAPAGTAEGNGETVRPAHSRRDAVFDRERLQPLQNASVISFRAIIQISDLDSTLIPYYPSYYFDVRIGTMLDLSLEF